MWVARWVLPGSVLVREQRPELSELLLPSLLALSRSESGELGRDACSLLCVRTGQGRGLVWVGKEGFKHGGDGGEMGVGGVTRGMGTVELEKLSKPLEIPFFFVSSSNPMAFPLRTLARLPCAPLRRTALRPFSLWPATPTPTNPLPPSDLDALSTPVNLPQPPSSSTFITPDVSPLGAESGVIDPLMDLAKLPLHYGDLKAMGLGSWWPTGIVQNTLEAIHVSTGLPWFVQEPSFKPPFSFNDLV